MEQEDKTLQQAVEHYIRVALNDKCGNKRSADILTYLTTDDIFFVIFLRMLDRLENIEKLLTRDEKYLILPVRQQTDDDKISILPLDCNIEHNKGE